MKKKRKWRKTAITCLCAVLALTEPAAQAGKIAWGSEEISTETPVQNSWNRNAVPNAYHSAGNGEAIPAAEIFDVDSDREDCVGVAPATNSASDPEGIVSADAEENLDSVDTESVIKGTGTAEAGLSAAGADSADSQQSASDVPGEEPSFSPSNADVTDSAPLTSNADSADSQQSTSDTSETEPSFLTSNSPDSAETSEGADFSLTLAQKEATPKAGQKLTYILTLENTGDTPLYDLALAASTSSSELTAAWKEDTGLQIQGETAVLDRLAKGAVRELCFTVTPGEGDDGTLLVHASVTAGMQNSEVMQRETSLSTEVQPLKADFTVEKTADCDQARPGETVTYQICIKNTGERTLHSVVSTERFINSNIRAQFLEAEGIRLNSTKTQALIMQLRPGEEVGLTAVVTIPENPENTELINQVTVVSDETGEQSVQSQTAVQVITPTVPPTETPSEPDDQAADSAASSSSGKTAPKTGDDTPISCFSLLAAVSLLTVFSRLLINRFAV